MADQKNVTFIRSSEDIDRRLSEIQEALRGPLHGGGGGGTSGGMEARVAKLESDVGHILTGIAELKSDVSAIRTQTSATQTLASTLDERTKALPTKDDVGKTVRDWMLVFLAVITAINAIGLVLVRFISPGGP